MERLGLFDIFKQPVKLTMKKNKGLSFENGSIAGFLLTFILVVVSAVYINSQHSQMESFVNDSYKSETITNSMKEWAEFKMNDYNFMPTIEIMQYGDIDKTGENSFKIKDIMDDSVEVTQDDSGWYSAFPMDMDKISTFIEPTINFRQIVDGATSYISEPMRRCRAEDFESRGYVFKTEKDRLLATYRLCPNWERLDFLKVKNDYTNT